MSLGTLDRTTPSFMRQGPSALSQIVLYIALALLLMVADVRWRITDPLRQVVSTVLYPVQWLMVQPLEFFSRGADYFHALQTAQDQADTARKEVLQLSLRANQAQELLQENERLRKLLDLRERLQAPARAAQNPVRHGRPLHAARGRGPGPGTRGGTGLAGAGRRWRAGPGHAGAPVSE